MTCESKCVNPCPDNPPIICIKRYDTHPPLRVAIEECEENIDFSDESLILTYNMWSHSKLKSNITNTEEYIALADNINYYQNNIGDKILISNPRNVEVMNILEFNEENKSIKVERAQEGTTAQSWKKGEEIKIFRKIDGNATIEVIKEDILQTDGTILENQVIENIFVANWDEIATEIPGCYWLEFKLSKIDENNNIEWTRRFPSNKEGFFIRIVESSIL